MSAPTTRPRRVAPMPRAFLARGTRMCLSTLLLLCISLGATAAPREARVPGGVAYVTLAPADAAPAPQARFAGASVLVTRRNGAWQALVGLPLDLPAGEHRLEVLTPSGTQAVAFTVRDKRYPEQRITLKNQGMVTLAPDDAERAGREIEEIRALKRHWQAAPGQAPDLDFVRPADGRLSGRFGLRRVFNGEPRAPHVGLDIAVGRGTPVKSAAAGTVLATGDYFFNGKTVFVDHGQGLLSMYCHLDRIDVRPGERLARSQALGRSGASGRASGPHLHWSVILNGAMVDPELFLAPPP